MPDLVELLDRTDLVDLAGEGSYFRGVGYAEAGRVELRENGADRVTAVVAGTSPYRVELATARNRLAWSCTCPIGVTGDCCKHAVAVALVVLGELGGDPAGRDDAEVDLAAYVASLPVDALAAIVVDQADRDWHLRERLVASARAQLGLDVDEAAWRKRVDAAFRRQGRFVDYRSAPGWAEGVFDLLDAIEELLVAGHHAIVITLTERCHRKAEAAVGYVDDSDGYITDIFHRVAELHLRACVESRPPPVPLARRLAKLELAAELDTFHRAAASYADVLGPSGLAAYRKIVEPRWAALRPERDQWSHEGFRVRQAMIGIALASGDPDELIRVLGPDVRSPYDQLEIVEFLRRTGRDDDALEWARAGIERYADRPHQLRELLTVNAELLRARGEGAAAVDVFADAFTRHPTIDAYQRLIEAAQLADDLDERRRAAHDLASSDPRLSDVSVAMLLHDGDADAAWLTATVHGCSRGLWLQLAQAREAEHPLEVLPVYQDEIEREIETKKKAGYQRAVKRLAHVRELEAAGGAPERFDAILADIRLRHAPKRSLIALIDQRIG
jgi:uncharacterized Zn finger protein